MPFSRGNGSFLSRLDRADLESKGGKHLGERRPDHGIVFDKQDAQRFQDGTSSPAPPSFTHAST